MIRKLYSLIIIITLAVLFTDCHRRPLEWEDENTALIPIHIDWSQSSLEQSTIQRATVILYPHDGSRYFTYSMQSSITDDMIPVPVGSYSIIVINEGLEDSEYWSGMRFENVDSYDEFYVSTIADLSRVIYSKTAGEELRVTPKPITSWNLDELTVTQDMITRSRASDFSARSLVGRTTSHTDAELSKLMNVQPLPLTKQVKITAYVHNLRSASLCQGTLSGATAAVMVATRQPLNTVPTVLHAMRMNNRQYDRDEDGTVKNHGTVEANFFVFTLTRETDYSLTMDFTLTDGKKVDPEQFDINDQVNKGQEQGDEILDLNVGQKDLTVEPEDPFKDRPIELPESQVGGNVDVDGWDDAIDVPIG